MKRVLLVTAAALAVLAGGADEGRAVSGAAAIALEFPAGARYNALGEAGVALAQDATANWWNPGGLAFASDRNEPRDLQIMQSSLAAGLADDISFWWGGYSSRMGNGGNLGFSFTYLSMGEQVQTDESGVEGETFTSYMFAVGAAYGTKLSPNLGAGVGVKYFRDRLAPDSALQDGKGGSGDSFGFDAGLLWKVPAARMNIGFAISNLGPNVQHVDADQSDPMPRKMIAGVAYSVFASESSALLLVGDVLVPLVNWNEDKQDYGFGPDFKEDVIGVGVEWSYVQSLFLRFGYKNDHAGDIQDYTWGFGLDLNRWLGQGISFGYASVPQAKDLDNVNRFSLGFSF